MTHVKGEGSTHKDYMYPVAAAERWRSRIKLHLPFGEVWRAVVAFLFYIIKVCFGVMSQNSRIRLAVRRLPDEPAPPTEFARGVSGEVRLRLVTARKLLL